ncbi:Gfo/Idh/MocA family oxidoreductase [Paenibacillus sp. GYB004]|uniref:Gfo/Idh/MocA family protein n=1 Tax=Paenibacillus sp. GYB004 TaxID=2994393 RepID=UPI002F962006
MRYRTAVIGAGRIADSHIRGIQAIPDFALVAIADVNEERARELGQPDQLRCYTDYREMIRKEKPDAAIIALPHYLHREAAIFCAEHGCHLMIEKPMAIGLNECDEIIDAVRRCGVKAMVGHTQHYMAANRAARELVRSGALGTLVMINDTRHGNYFAADRPDWFFRKALAGGGRMMNLGSHSVDRIQWITGRSICKVKASLTFYGNRGDVEGSGLVYAENADGVPITISQSGYIGAPRNELELIFTGGMIRIEGGNKLSVSRGGNYEQADIEAGESSFARQYGDFLEMIRSGREPECSLDYARGVIAVVESMYHSHECGRIIEVPQAGRISGNAL